MQSYDPYEIMLVPPNKKTEMIVEEICKGAGSNLNLVRDLITLGANLDWQDNNSGRTALHVCAYKNQPEILRMLIHAGADVNIQDYDGWTALHWCTRSNQPEIAKLLIEAGADVNIQENITGRTALHMSQDWSHIEIYRMLILAGADKTIKRKHLLFQYTGDL